MKSVGLFVVVLLYYPAFLYGQYSYPPVYGCDLISGLIKALDSNKLDIKTYDSFFDDENEIEVGLDFKWCEARNIPKDSCMRRLSEYVKDTSLALLKLHSEFGFNIEFDAERCLILKEIEGSRVSNYMMEIKNKVYIFVIDRKRKRIADVVVKPGKSLFFDENSESLMRIYSKYFTDHDDK
jgi:hypothetical protein